ncbi:MAG: hypothetical protein J6V57_08135, partial [Spirochaetaceae bacterium]|nr:hypothetical protein [Spirochaetaceae bacterium]
MTKIKLKSNLTYFWSIVKRKTTHPYTKLPKHCILIRGGLMSYEVLEAKLKTIPEEFFEEISAFLDFIS